MSLFAQHKKRKLVAIALCCIVLIVAILVIIGIYLESQTEISQASIDIEEEPMPLKESFKKLQTNFGLPADESAIIVILSEQKLLFVKNEEILKSYPISGSAYGPGNRAGSNKTPLGTHTISHKIGDGAEIGTIFRARVNTGEFAKIYMDDTDVAEDLVTTRLMWLQGMEPGVNKGQGIDSHARYIYIHGTNQETVT